MSKILTFFLKSLMSKIAGTVLIVMLLIGGFFGLQTLCSNVFGLDFGLFGFGKELKIDNTANVVEKIKEISELTTTCYYEEAVIKDYKVEQSSAFMGLLDGETSKEIVMIAKGKVRAGYNLSKITKEQICISGDTISIQLPQPEIFDVIINPSDYEMYVEDGKWSHEEISALQAAYRQKLISKANEIGIINKAKDSGKKRIENLFMTFGFSVVKINCN